MFPLYFFSNYKLLAEPCGICQLRARVGFRVFEKPGNRHRIRTDSRVDQIWRDVAWRKGDTLRSSHHTQLRIFATYRTLPGRNPKRMKLPARLKEFKRFSSLDVEKYRYGCTIERTRPNCAYLLWYYCSIFLILLVICSTSSKKAFQSIPFFTRFVLILLFLNWSLLCRSSMRS